MDNRLVFPPQKIIELGDKRILITGMDGELQIINESMEIESEHKTPFPTAISQSSVSNNTLFACWVDLELMIARMAAIELNSEIHNGPSRSELRIELSHEIQPQVTGSKWSHTLDSEPLALIAGPDYVAFTTWKRGIYCIDHNSNELWRIPEIKWKNKLSSANLVVSMENTNQGLMIWSKGAEWALINGKDGQIIDQGEIEFENILEKTFSFENNTLLCCPEGNILWIEDLNSTDSLTMKQKGPVHDAKWDFETQCWRLCAWREDILWSKSSIQKQSRKEIGKAIFKSKDTWMVLDNSGYFSKHIN